MGLDMYLYAEKYLSPHTFMGEDLPAQHAAVTEAVGISTEEHAILDVCVGYWRKANAIHGWFVENVQDGVDECQKSYVPRQALEALRVACQEVLDADDEDKENVASEQGLLPRAGFFFGSTEIDEWYEEDLRATVQIIDNALELKDVDFAYRSSW